MIADSMVSLVKNSSVIRAMFEEGNRLARLYGAENVMISHLVTLMFQHLQRLMKQLRI